MPLTEQGYIPRNTSEWFDIMLAIARTKFGEEFTAGNDTFAGHLITLFADNLANIDQDNLALFNSRDPKVAEGVSLEIAASRIGITRKVNETNEVLRERYYESLARSGSCTGEAIRARILDIVGVTHCYVAENTTLENPDERGLPAKSFVAVVDGGTDDNIAQVIYDSGKAAGIESFGNTSGAALDRAGNTINIFFGRSSDIYFRVIINYTVYDEESLSTTYESDIKLAIAKYAGDYFSADKDVFAKKFMGYIYGATGGLGDVDVTLQHSENEDFETILDPNDSSIILQEPSEVGTEFTLGPFQKAVFSTDRIEISGT